MTMTTFCAVPTAVAFTITGLLLLLLLLLICPLLFLLLLLLLLLPVMPVLALVLFAIVLVELLFLRQFAVPIATKNHCHFWLLLFLWLKLILLIIVTISPSPLSRSWIPTLTAILLEVGGSSTPRNASKKDRGERLSTNSVFYSLKGVVIHAYWYIVSVILLSLENCKFERMWNSAKQNTTKNKEPENKWKMASRTIKRKTPKKKGDKKCKKKCQQTQKTQISWC